MSTEPKQLKEEIVEKEFEIKSEIHSDDHEAKAIIIMRSSITDGFAFTKITNRDIVNTVKSTIEFITAGKDDVCSKETFDNITKATEKLLIGLKQRIDNAHVYFNPETKMYSEGENTVEGLPIFSVAVFKHITENAIASVMPAALACTIDENVDPDSPVRVLYGTTVITLTAEDIATLFPVFPMKHEKEFYETDKDKSFMFPFRKDLIASFTLNAINAAKDTGLPATVPALQCKTYYDLFCQYINKGTDITDAKKYYQDAQAEDAVYKTVFDELTIRKFSKHYESICRFSTDLIAISEQSCRNVIKEDEDGRNPYYDIYRRDESDDLGSAPRYIDDCYVYDKIKSLAVFEAKGPEYLEMFSTVYCENKIQVCIDDYAGIFDKLIQLIYTDYDHTFVSTLVFLTLGRCHREMVERISQAIPDGFNVPKIKEVVQKYLNNQKEHGIDNLMEGWYNAIPSKYKTDALNDFIKGEGVFAGTDKYLKKLSEWLLTGASDSRTDFVCDVKTQYIIGEASGVTGQDVVDMLNNTKRAIDGSLYLTCKEPVSEYCSLSGIDVVRFGYPDRELNIMSETNPAAKAYYINKNIEQKKETVDNFVLRPDAYFVVVELMHAIHDLVSLKIATPVRDDLTPYRDVVHYALEGLFFLINRFKEDFPTPDETWGKTLLELKKVIKVSTK